MSVALLCASPGPGVAQSVPSESWPSWYSGGDSLRAGVHAIEKDSSYIITGSTASDLQADMDERAPIVADRRVQGAHVWEWWHHYEYGPDGGGLCVVTESVVLVRSVIVLPRWAGNQTADRELVRAWNGYRFRLREHEDGHRMITLASAAELLDAVQSRPPSPCPTLRDEVRALADSVFESSASAQTDYDNSTAHGLLQGARWPPGDG